MPSATAAFVSFRLGGADGVSVVTDTWRSALSDLGFRTVTVAGAGPVDHVVPGLRLDAPGAPSRAELERTLATIDLVVVENLLTIPLNLPASRVVTDVLRGRPAVLHHHDPPWHRARYAHVDRAAGRRSGVAARRHQPAGRGRARRSEASGPR